MARKKGLWIPAGIDVVLIGIAATLLIAGALLLWLSPTWWGCYRTVLDIRFWPPWKILGLAVLAIESLLVIRYWPNRKGRTSSRSATAMQSSTDGQEVSVQIREN